MQVESSEKKARYRGVARRSPSLRRANFRGFTISLWIQKAISTLRTLTPATGFNGGCSRDWAGRRSRDCQLSPWSTTQEMTDGFWPRMVTPQKFSAALNLMEQLSCSKTLVFERRYSSTLAAYRKSQPYRTSWKDSTFFKTSYFVRFCEPR